VSGCEAGEDNVYKSVWWQLIHQGDQVPLDGGPRSDGRLQDLPIPENNRG
jgi:hypothetical protein